MKGAFGDNFVITDKVDLSNFCKTMMDTMTASIEDSKLHNQSLANTVASNAKKPVVNPIFE